jgi:predicted phosphodiesterase
MGHRHVPWAVKIHKTLLVNAGTFSCNRTRAHYGYTFNVIDIEDKIITVSIVDIRKEQTRMMVEFNLKDGCCVNQYYESSADK